MGIKGRNRKARPLDVYKALTSPRDTGWPPQPHPKPGAKETFKDFGVRLEGSQDYVLELLTKLGWGEPTQAEYLRRLSELRALLGTLDFNLHDLYLPS